MQRGSAQILSLIAIVVLIVTGIYLYSSKSQNPQSQSAVKSIAKVLSSTNTYSSSQLGFEFIYSNGLSVKEDNEELFNKRGNGDFRKNFKGYVTYEPGKFAGAVVVLGKDSSYDTNPFTVWIFDNPEDLSINSWYQNYWYYPFVWGDYTSLGKITLAPKIEASVSGQIGKSGVIDYQPGKPKFIYVKDERSSTSSKKMYLFRIIGSDGDKILESFKFSQ